MKKIYVLLSVILCSLILTGYSYGYWSETLIVNGTAETGELSVIFTEEHEIDKPPFVLSDNVVTTKKFTVDISNLYPGVKYITQVEMENIGTIPAILDFVEILSTDQNKLSQYIRVTLEFITEPNLTNPIRSIVLNGDPDEMLPHLGLLLEVNGPNSTGLMNVIIEVLDGAPYDESVDFTLQLNFVHFNAINFKTNKGNHYGNDKKDYNEKDDKNKHDGENTYDDHHESN
ncbi:hypothetical protein RJG79_11090 [Mycoplasmatota bacterium WC44]